MIFLALLLVVVVVFAIFGLAAGKQLGGPDLGGHVDISVLRLGIDRNARTHVQQQLGRIGGTHDLGLLLRESALVLRRARDSWVYAGVINAQPAGPAAADAHFRVVAARSRGFRREGDAAGDRDLAVVTIAVAARAAIVDFHDPANAEEVRRWLEAISQLHGSALDSIEINWTPSDDADAMTAAELEGFYPEMKRIRADTVEGRAVCRYCGGRFPGELLSCPHCGGKVQEAA